MMPSVLILALALAAAPAEAAREGAANDNDEPAAQPHATGPLGDSSHSLTLDLGVSVSAPAGALGVSYGKGKWFARGELNPWISLSTRSPVQPGALNLSVGRQWVWANGQVRSAVAAGLSTLFFDTVLHQRGRTGLSLHWTPLSWRKPFGPNRTLRLEPISLHIAMPVLSGIPLLVPQYRHGVGLEWAL